MADGTLTTKKRDQIERDPVPLDLGAWKKLAKDCVDRYAQHGGADSFVAIVMAIVQGFVTSTLLVGVDVELMVMHDAHDKRHPAVLIPAFDLNEVGVANQDEK